jgi:hypothetical protein
MISEHRASSFVADIGRIVFISPLNRQATSQTDLEFSPVAPQKYSMRIRFVTLLACLCAIASLHAADASYKEVLVVTGTNSVRVRLPLTDVTGKVRVKETAPGGFGLPVAPSQTVLGKKHYLEWQIGYDTPTTNSPTLVPQIKFTRKGETKYGHELSKILFECVRIGLISTNEIADELALLKKDSTGTFEESRAVEVEVNTNQTVEGFQSAVQKVPQFTKTTAHGSVQIQLKQKQRAVGYQAMIYVCLPMREVLAMDGAPRKPAKASSKETVLYEFNAGNTTFLMDIVHAFGIASQQHNEDIQKILGKILEASGRMQE